VRRFVRDNSLSIFFLPLFVLALGFQSLAGWQDFNNAQLRHHGEAIGYGRYLLSSEFGVAMLENWQSEYLQFSLYVVATVWFLQRGSPESKELDKPGASPTRSRRSAAMRTRARRAGQGSAGCARACTRTRC
jgi:hypothetical protein